MLRVLGLWLLYAVAGIVLAIAAVGNGSVDFDEEKRSPTRFRTKVVGALSGGLLAAGALGSVLMRDPDAAREMALTLAAAGWSTGALVTVVAWGMIARDLGRQHAKRA